MPMKKFKKKPVVIEAIELRGDTFDEIENILGVDGMGLGDGTSKDETCITIATLEGDMNAHKGDWIIKDIKGEFYPCKPDIFDALYEFVD